MNMAQMNNFRLEIILKIVILTTISISVEAGAKQTGLSTKEDAHKQPWNPEGIPYAIYPHTPMYAVRRIQASLKELMKKTCLKFKKRSEEKSYIGFRHKKWGGGCYVSSIGINDHGATNITLSARCLSRGSIQHQLFHALGFHHEQNRPDAGKYVSVNKDSMRKLPWKGAILRLLPFVTYKEVQQRLPELVGPFDYRSVLFYDDLLRPRKNARTPVLINKQQPDMQVGSVGSPTEMDYLKVNVFYNCRGVKISRGEQPGEWGSWGQWTPENCPVRCGIGFQQRFRWCNGGIITKCPGLSTETRQCDSCAGKNCRNLGGDRFCKAFADCSREYHLMYCRKLCKYCGQSTVNKKSDYFCIRYARPHCKEKWAQIECPVTCLGHGA